MLYCSIGSSENILSQDDLKTAFLSTLKKLGDKKKVLAIPPDFTRLHSQTGLLTEATWEYYGENLKDILPALGTHVPMTNSEIDRMFGKTPKDLFRIHDWRNGVRNIGEVPASVVEELSGGKVSFPVPMEIANLLADGEHDLVLSLGQVVPHEVIGMANYNKNIFVGVGGSEGIHKSHFLGAAYGMEQIMGRSGGPVRGVLNYASEHFTKHIPILYVLTVVGLEGELRGLFIGDDLECFEKASELSLQVNFNLLNAPLKKVVVYLDPDEFKSTWLGNKSIYRTRMAIADQGELIVLAPGVKEFGEDPTIDHLIRKYGYKGTPKTLDNVDKHKDLKENLSAAAHLIHGSSEDRFEITYCPGHLSQQEIEGVGYKYASLEEMSKKYNPDKLKNGVNIMPDGEEIYYISNPALGLWAFKDRF